MLFHMREPLALMAPYGKPGHIGDIFEAVFGFCFPHNRARLAVRDAFGARLGISDGGFRACHSHLEGFVKATSRLVAVAGTSP